METIKTILAVIGAAYLVMTIVGWAMLIFRTKKSHNENLNNTPVEGQGADSEAGN